MQNVKRLPKKPAQTRNLLGAIQDDELYLMWQKVKKDPDRLFTKLQEHNNLLLLDFVAQLYARDMLDAEDWRLICANVDAQLVFSKLLLSVETTRKFQAMVLNTLQLGIYHSCKDFDMTSRFYNACARRQHGSTYDLTELGNTHHNVAWFAKS